GLTETSPFITICESRPQYEALACSERSVIKACQGVELLTSGELRVVDEQGNEVPHDGQSLGEIIVRGNAVMKGYYKDPEATSRVIRDGWFYTGDAAVVHPNGYAEIRDRLKVFCCGIRLCRKWRSWGFRTSVGVRRRMHS